MAESILYGTVQNILDQLASLAVEEFSLAWGLVDDLRRLQKTLTCIRAVLSDAEEQRFTNHKISLWLRRLRDVLYSAEDVLADFAYEALRREVVSSRGGISRKVRRFFSSSNPVAYRLRIGHEIKEVRKRLDEIKSDKDEFNLSERVDHGRLQLREREMTNSLVNASEVIGRDKDREKIVELLIDSYGRGDDHNVLVIPIVGIGGMGKTALAKLVYNDRKVAGHFDSKAWVCLGDMKKFNVNHIMAAISGQTTLNNSEGLENFIQDKFRTKKFLLVLDDLWDADRSKWLDLKGMLSSNVRGSKILITTRDSSVARCVATVPAHDLPGLAHEQCVSLFKKLAFANEAEADENLMKIGDEIVRKCKGVPLAVRTLGSLLFSKPDEREWTSVRDSSIWQISGDQNDILAILKFSYDRLPSHLKLCFVYCSVFPEDYHIQGSELISLWMAHGLLKGHDPEYVGKQFINEFLCRGFFQDFVPKRISLSEFKKDDILATCNDHDQVRSLIISHSGIELYDDFSFQCNNLRLLWVVDSEILELPKCVGSLRYLKYLNLQGCYYLKTLPESICKLHNLETLSLLNCFQLREIPKSIGELVNLRWLASCPSLKSVYSLSGSSSKQLSLPALETLELNSCGIDDASEFLHIAPNLVSLEINSLEQLETLCGSTPECLHTLRHLRIRSCNKLTALPGWLPNLTSLRSLSLEHCTKLSSLPQSMESLTALQNMRIIGCGELTKRGRRRQGEEWSKIAHVPDVDFDYKISDD